MKKCMYVFAAGLLLSGAGFTEGYSQAGAATVKTEKFNFHKAGEDDAGYAQAVKVGNTIYISGTVAGGDMQAQVKGIYERLQKTLENYGATFANVVKENVYTTDIEELKKHNEIRKAFYRNQYPAATWVEIRRLYMEQAKLEVELIAVVPEKG
jgi:2-iminobutanoate/2-iminopropanoate deaminase